MMNGFLVVASCGSSVAEMSDLEIVLFAFLAAVDGGSSSGGSCLHDDEACEYFGKGSGGCSEGSES